MIGLYVGVSSCIFNSQFEHLKRRRHVLPALRNSPRSAATCQQARKADVCACVCVSVCVRVRAATGTRSARCVSEADRRWRFDMWSGMVDGIIRFWRGERRACK